MTPSELLKIKERADRSVTLNGMEELHAYVRQTEFDRTGLLQHIAELERVIAEGKEDREEGATLIRKMSVGGWMWDQIKAAKAALAWADKKPRTP